MVDTELEGAVLLLDKENRGGKRGGCWTDETSA